MKTRIQIVVLNPAQAKSYEGRAYTTQTAECILLNDDGSASQVGVLRLGRDYTDVITVTNGVTTVTEKKSPNPGQYEATFALTVSPKDRTIGASIVELKPARAPAATGAVSAKA